MLFKNRATGLLLLSVITLMALVSCATSSTAPTGDQFLPVADKAVVFLARPGGMAVATINIDGQPVGTMKGGQNIKLTLDAGDYTISHIGAGGLGPAVIPLSAKANEVYFVEIDFGGMGGAKAELLDQNDGEKLVNKSSKPGTVF